MKTRLIILFSLLNIAVLIAGFSFLRQYLDQKLEKKPEPVVVQSLDSLWQRKSGKLVAAAAQSIPQPTVIFKTNDFKWSQIETNDYRQYIVNLRRIGCPEPTIKDIILTDVMKLYAARRGHFYDNGRQFKFWETDEKRKLKQQQLEERDKQLAQIDKELPAVLRELLGINYERELDKYFVDSNEDDRRLAFLSEEKRDRLLALRDQIEGQRERVLGGAPSSALTTSDLEMLKKIQEQRDAALAKILTPAEKEEYELTTSETADRLRKELIGFNPSETEFREIFRRQQSLDAKFAFENLTDEAVRHAKTAEQEKLDQEVKNVFGGTRAADFDRAKDTDYQNLYVFSERFDLPQTTTQNLLDMRQVAEEERRKLLANKEIPAERRAQALRAIQAETERTFRQTLGDKAFAEYSQSAGGWMHGLGTN